MPVNYTYQDSVTLTSIAPELIIAKSLEDPIFKIFPIRKRNSSKLRWTIKDSITGLMNLRGLGGEPTRISRVGTNVYEALPGAYGEFDTIDEIEMTNRASGVPADMTVPIAVDDLVADIQEVLTVREYNRMRQICWLLALNHTFAVPLTVGGIGHTESYTGTDVTLSGGALWSAPTTSTPLANLRSLQTIYGRGTSTMFGSTAQAWMNSLTANYLLANTNAADLGGKRVEGGNTINDIDGINRIYLSQNVPQINIWDDGYLDDSKAFQLFIPDGKVLIVGARPGGESPGEFQITRNANNEGMAADAYAFVDDRTTGPTKTVPPRIDVHQGFNGGPVVERPKQLITLTVA